ncbi:A-kinase anchor protein 1, mitochondrial [Anastrepha obliqua]|uniref:A-kinase anchor protein 1, mitochondrial n=1 Tax=Anastrepha obliqua TaxID=95512 RepID=UPI00240A03C6|nr:A-kinase anchor protein 1, mitochondrial [Anastrepha obliqua]XP_054728714.1 A-kinase anchor protein 1, mitochondrial [Anastrepha obliqua]XP_054728715.1 A-kinase anchor protein 1, mitochondrial [Anastrepha obliqua]
MVSRPLLYMSLPGVVFILGVFWYRRRNKNREIGDTSAGQPDTLNKPLSDELPTHKIDINCSRSKSNPLPSDSVNINNKNPDEEESPTVRLFGKSAPIKIVQNSRGSPVKQQQVNSEVLKSKIQDAENKVLRSIDEDFENLSSPIDLPDSFNKRIAFYSRNVNCKNDAPVVIRATRTPKISPENSFLESKYTKESEENNNLKPIESVIKESKEGKQQEQPNQSSSIIQQESEQQPILQQNCMEGATVNATSQDIGATDNDKRDVDAASPSLSLCSVQSGDSGKGSSLPRSEANRAKTTYEFFFPNSFVGHLYGRKHSFINHIKVKTSANVVISKTNYAGKFVCICTIEGSESEIKSALAMIRQRLPAKRYPNFTMQRIHFAPPQTVVPLSTESLLNLQLNLIEGINNDVLVTAVVNGAHMFVQHPLHPSHPSLAVLQKCLYDSYTGSEAPLLPGIEINAVCVLPVNGIWYRVQIVEQDCEDEQRCVVKFLDFGGYMNVHFNELRQIRSDFMTVPFQATECILSNVEPIDSIRSEAADILCQLTKGIVLQAQVAGYNSHNIPEIYLFVCLSPNNVIFINKELVARNLAKWVERD